MLFITVITALAVLTCGKLHWATNRDIRLAKYSGADLDDAFQEWKADFGKKYANKEEEERHFLTFLDNWVRIIHFNDHENRTYTLGFNQFADLNHRQFRRHIHGGRGSCLLGHKRTHWRESASSESQSVNASVGANPASVDWTTKGVVTPVKNQGQCGSCWAFSSTGSIECRTAISTGKLVSLSEQQLVDCSRRFGNQGCNGGYMEEAFRYVKSDGGLCSENEYPYKGRDGVCKASSCGTKYDPVTGFSAPTKDKTTSLETAVASGCVSVGVEADQTAWQFYKSGIMSGRCGTNLDHGVLVVGYGEEGGKKFWKVKNSWGASWGEGGYLRVCKECNKDNGEGECGILHSPSFPTV